MNRHIDQGYRLKRYARQAIVRCVECDTISQIYHRYENECKSRIENNCFTCPNCQLSLVSNRFRGDWVGKCRLIGNQPCSKCGTRLIVKGEIVDSYKNSLPYVVTVNCPNCIRANEIAVSHCKLYDASLAIDPDLGLPLFLQIPSRFGKIWAFNQAHLTELQAYVNATLRERTIEAEYDIQTARLDEVSKKSGND